MKFTYSIPTVNGEPVVRIKIRKKETVSDYQIYPDKHVFTTDYEHKELKPYMIHKGD